MYILTILTIWIIFREINRCPTEKLSSKAAKEMYEHSCKIETELKEQINGKCIC